MNRLLLCYWYWCNDVLCGVADKFASFIQNWISNCSFSLTALSLLKANVCFSLCKCLLACLCAFCCWGTEYFPSIPRHCSGCMGAFLSLCSGLGSCVSVVGLKNGFQLKETSTPRNHHLNVSLFLFHFFFLNCAAHNVWISPNHLCFLPLVFSHYAQKGKRGWTPLQRLSHPERGGFGRQTLVKFK